MRTCSGKFREGSPGHQRHRQPVTTRGLCADVFRAVLAAHELVTCAQVIQEVRRILRMKFGVPEPLIAEYLELIGQDAIVAEPGDLPDLPIRDQDDAEIVAAAIGARQRSWLPAITNCKASRASGS